ncbi:hypothetical protein D3C77_343030 [compost metagenome]
MDDCPTKIRRLYLLEFEPTFRKVSILLKAFLDVNEPKEQHLDTVLAKPINGLYHKSQLENRFYPPNLQPRLAFLKLVRQASFHYNHPSH